MSPGAQGALRATTLQQGVKKPEEVHVLIPVLPKTIKSTFLFNIYPLE